MAEGPTCNATAEKTPERAGLYGTGQFAVDGSRQSGAFSPKRTPANALHAEAVKRECDTPRVLE